ncbi:hypothetical protein HN873_033352, partial [Arachis hypogaea]
SLVLHNNSINNNISNVLLNSKVLILNENNLRGNMSRVSPNTKENNNSRYLDLSHNLILGERLNSPFNSLFNNRLSRDVLLSLRNCEKFHVLNLGENNGNIFTKICKLDFLKILNFSNNKLSRPILSCCNMTSMIFKNKSFDSFGVIILMIFHKNCFIFVFIYNHTMLIRSIKLDYTHSMRVIDFSRKIS